MTGDLTKLKLKLNNVKSIKNKRTKVNTSLTFIIMGGLNKKKKKKKKKWTSSTVYAFHYVYTY